MDASRIDLAPDLQSQLRRHAAQAGLDPSAAYIARLVEDRLRKKSLRTPRLMPHEIELLRPTVSAAGGPQRSMPDGTAGGSWGHAAPSRALARVPAIASALIAHEKGQQAAILGTSCDDHGTRQSLWKRAGRAGSLRTL